MLELTRPSQQTHNQHNPRAELVRNFKETQHARFQVLADKMRARMANDHCEIDQDVSEIFFKRVLAVTYQNWMCKP